MSDASPLAAPAAVSAAVAAPVPVLAGRVVLAEQPALQPVPADLEVRAQLPALVDPVVRAEQRVLAEPVGQAHLVVDSALLLDLLSRQSFSAAMVRSSPSPAAPTYEPVPRSR
jgi:hypothetical protein